MSWMSLVDRFDRFMDWGSGHNERTAMVEQLEGRFLLAVFIVTSVEDAGAGTLRQAIIDANASPGADEIHFNIDGTGVQTINLASPLPFVTQPVTIDGYTQPGASANNSIAGNNAVLLIELNGAAAGVGEGLRFTGGPSVVRGLVINGFSEDAIRFQGTGGHVVEGNFLGTNPAGTAAVGNGGAGVAMQNSSGNTIGGTAPAARNIIGGNGIGIAMLGNSSSNTVQGNFIGLAADASAAIGNSGHGVLIADNASDNLIGGILPGEGNVIGNSGGAGVAVTDNAVRNSILSNSIFDNDIGIDLGDDGHTRNDLLDEDMGPNNQQNFPRIFSASFTAGIVNIQGSLHSTPNTTFRIELFDNPAGHRQGRFLLPSTEVTTDDDGNAQFEVSFEGSLVQGGQVTGTATDPDGNTSEFTAPPQVQFEAGVISFESATVPVSEAGGAVVLTVLRTVGTEGTVAIDFATADGTAVAGQDYVAVSDTLVFQPGQTSRTITIPIIDNDIRDGNRDFTVNLSNPAGIAVLGEITSATVTIVDDEGAGIIVAGAGRGMRPHVRVFNAADGEEMFRFLAYDPRFRGGVNVAVGDIDGDGIPDIITAAAGQGGPHVRVFSGLTGEQLPGTIGSFMAFDEAFRGGVFVAVGDVNGDGTLDIITGAGRGGLPHVRVFSGQTGEQLPGPVGDFFAFDTDFRGGVRVAAGDLNGDGRADIITGAGPAANSTPRVRAFAGANGDLLADFLAYRPGFRGGIFVAAGDVNGDGRDDIITGPGSGHGPNVRAFSGEDQEELFRFRAMAPRFNTGVRVGTMDFNGDGFADIIVGAGPNNPPRVRILSGLTQDVLLGFLAFHPANQRGVFVAGTGDVIPLDPENDDIVTA